MIHIDVKNVDKILKKFDRVKDVLPKYVEAANKQSASEILKTQGLKKYPPATAANKPPVPYYIRGRGTQTASGNKLNSERLGTKWKTVPYGHLGMKISNPVTYAHNVHGETQPWFMKRIGWRKLLEVAKEKVGIIAGIYDRWVAKLIRDSGL